MVRTGDMSRWSRVPVTPLVYSHPLQDPLADSKKPGQMSCPGFPTVSVSGT